MKRIISSVICSLLIISGIFAGAALPGGMVKPAYAASFQYGVWYNWLAFAVPSGSSNIEFMCDGSTLFIRGNEEIPQWMLPVYDEETGEVISDISYYPWNEVSMSFSKIVIQSGVTGICEYFLQSQTALASLTSIYIPATVTHFGWGVFEYSRLKDIYYEGTQAQWNSIERDGEDGMPSGTQMHYSSTYQGGGSVVETKPVPAPTKTDFVSGSTSTGFKFYPTRAEYLGQKNLASSSIGSMLNSNMVENACSAIPGIVNTYIGKNVKTYVPQGLCRFAIGSSTYYLITAYDSMKTSASVLYVMDSGWKLVKTIVLPNIFHNGGIAYDQGSDVVWFTGDTGGGVKTYTVMSLRGSVLAGLIRSSGSTGTINSFDNVCVIDNKASCLDYHGGRLWVGTCTGADPGIIIGYKTSGTSLSRTGTVSVSGIKAKLNGFTFGDDNDIYVSYSSGRYKSSYSKIVHAKYTNGNLTGSVISLAPGAKVLDVPRMNEEIMLNGNYLYVLYESAAAEYCANAYIKTDRITAINKSVLTVSSLRSTTLRSAALSSGELMTLAEGEETEISFEYDADSDINTTEQDLEFIPQAAGNYEIRISGLDHQNDLHVAGQLLDAEAAEDDPGRVLAEMSTVSVSCEDEEVYLLHGDSASATVNLTSGRTYKLCLDAASSTEVLGNTSYSGSYKISISRTGDIVAEEAAAGKEISQNAVAGSSSSFAFTPDETGTYHVTWDTEGEFSSMTASDSEGNPVALKDDYCELNAGTTYIFTAMLSEGYGFADSADVSFRIDRVNESPIGSSEDTVVTEDTMLSYHAEEAGMFIVRADAEAEQAPYLHISVYDSEGSLLGVGGESVVFEAAAGADYRIGCKTDEGAPSGDVKLRVEPYEEAPDEPTPEEPVITDLSNATIKMKTTYTFFRGMKAPLPVLSITGDNARTLRMGEDYVLLYDGKSVSTSATNVGVHKITATGTGDFCGTAEITYTINPAATALKSLKAAKKAVTVKWKKQSLKMASSVITGYQIQYSLKKNFKGAKTVTVKGYSKTSKKISKLKAKKNYYVRPWM